MDLGSLIAAVLLSIGMIGTDAVLNSGTISFNIEVSEDLAKGGYTPKLVYTMLDTDIKNLVEVRSVVRPPDIRSASEKSIVGSIAESLNLRDITSAFQNELGLNPLRIDGSLMQDNGRLRFLLTGRSSHNAGFTLDLHNKPAGEAIPKQEGRAADPGPPVKVPDRSMPEFIEAVARAIVEQVEPYAVAISEFDALQERKAFSSDPSAYARFKGFIESRADITSESGDTATDHAAFHNLLGMAALLSNDAAEAEKEFVLSAKTDLQLGIPLVNLATLYVSESRFDDALRVLAQAEQTKTVRRARFLHANLATVAGLAYWGKGDVDSAAGAFLDTVRLNPGTFFGYSYWAKLMSGYGSKADAKRLCERARTNLKAANTYPEVALLYTEVDPLNQFARRPADLAEESRQAEQPEYCG